MAKKKPGDVTPAEDLDGFAPVADAAPAEQPPGPAADEKGKKPKFGTAVPAGDGAVPRVVNQLARAPEGLTRYKVRCKNYEQPQARYVLAETEEQARECYLKASGVAAQVARLKKKGGEVEEPDLAVTELAD